MTYRDLTQLWLDKFVNHFVPWCWPVVDNGLGDLTFYHRILKIRDGIRGG